MDDQKPQPRSSILDTISRQPDLTERLGRAIGIAEIVGRYQGITERVGARPITADLLGLNRSIEETLNARQRLVAETIAASSVVSALGEVQRKIDADLAVWGKSAMEMASLPKIDVDSMLGLSKFNVSNFLLRRRTED